VLSHSRIAYRISRSSRKISTGASHYRLEAGILQDALREMILAYRQQKKEIPIGGALLEQIPAQV
jgi:hypothetical protein